MSRKDQKDGVAFVPSSNNLKDPRLTKYDNSISFTQNNSDEDDEDKTNNNAKRLENYSGPQKFIDEMAGPNDHDPLAHKMQAITEKRNKRAKYRRELSPGEDEKSYKEVMERRNLDREEQRVLSIINEKHKEEVLSGNQALIEQGDKTPPRKVEEEDEGKPLLSIKDESQSTITSNDKPTKKRSRWDSKTPLEIKKPVKKSRWDSQAPPELPTQQQQVKKRSRWDQTPTVLPAAQTQGAVSVIQPGATVTTQAPHEILSDEWLNSILPSEGYIIVDPPTGYIPLTVPSEHIGFQNNNTEYFIPPAESNLAAYDGVLPKLPTDIPGIGELQFFKKSDEVHFRKLLTKANEDDLSLGQLKERKILRLLLKVKNGTPQVRKGALRSLTDNARSFGAQALFQPILTLLMEPDLDPQERHLIAKVVDRVLYKLDDLIRPFTHKILVVIEPSLVDEDPYARASGREIISNLTKAAGLPHMISTLRADIDHADEGVRKTTAKTLAVVSKTLGIGPILPFLRAVCGSRKSWQARHTGSNIVKQIAILMGCAVLPYLKFLVDCIGAGLTDEQLKVRTITAEALSSLAEASAPFGIESFEPVIAPLWNGIRRHRGKALAEFLKCNGYIIPLTDAEDANTLTKQMMPILLREFNSPDDDMRNVVLKVLINCSATDGVKPQFLREEAIPPFFENFWQVKVALNRFKDRNYILRETYNLVIEAMVVIGTKVGASEIIDRTIDSLNDRDNELFRRMGVEAVEKVVAALGTTELSDRLVERLVDGLMYCIKNQTTEDMVVLNGVGTVINSLAERTQPYLKSIASVILSRLNHKEPAVRQQAADLTARIAIVMRKCNEDELMSTLGLVLYEYLGEEYPDVLGSIIGALRAIVTVVGIDSMKPDIGELLPRLTPILRNRNEKVQENTIDLVGRIADRAADRVHPKEWKRISFSLLEMLKSPKKGIRRAANNTFGYIAKAIGPQEVLVTLLDNLRVQERQLRVCTAVAIGIVAETCSPFTVLPALMNEYRTPEMNIQNGVLKSMSFMFEYIGEMAKDYVYAVTPLLEDALTDRDQVHRQTAASVVKHMALGCVGLGCEDVFIHFLNLLMPNIYETSPHVIERIMDGIDGVRNAVGPGIVLNYIWAGLFHPARKVREPYWKIYNSAYIQNCDSMVPYYPEFEEDEYKIEEMDFWI